MIKRQQSRRLIRRGKYKSKKCSNNSGKLNRTMIKRLIGRSLCSTEKEIWSSSTTMLLRENSASFKKKPLKIETKNFLKLLWPEKKP